MLKFVVCVNGAQEGGDGGGKERRRQNQKKWTPAGFEGCLGIPVVWIAREKEEGLTLTICISLIFS
jgi:hypothetical protein